MGQATIETLLRLHGEVALVTGAASGIGRGVAHRLAQAGASVALLDIDTAGGERAAREIGQSTGAPTLFVSCDVSSAQGCERAVRQAVERFGYIDVLVNNAGVIRRKNVVDLLEAEWDLVVDVSLKGAYLMSKHVIPCMRPDRGGSIVNMGSGWGLKGGPDAAAYCAAKGGIVNLTRAMAIDHGPAGIRVNCVCPGDTDTPLLRSEAVQLGADMDEFLREAAARPIGRVGTPDDIANAVLFFASPMSTWVTGATLVVDGGGLA
ncbi:MAG TPA: SDR family oxidoreductase [Bacillota bacterium]|jgi:NAD(P)-dependent dehydrogenase (short-subunit alcohol dehydrogenase family)|nr:SDR family oxidoreductase [Bacillota bacterium]